MSIVTRLLTFLDDSPSPFHAARTAARQLEAKGYVPVDERAGAAPLPAGSKGYVQRGGSLVAFRVGTGPVADAGFRLVCAHTDSPNLRIKPQPVIRSHGYLRLGVEPYGGVLLATWTDRDLGFAGRVTLRDGDGVKGVLVDFRRPLCRIPNLAIHLNREVNEQGLKLNKQTDLPAVLALSEDGGAADPFRDLLADEIGCEPIEILAWDLGLYDLTPATAAGLNQEFVHSARLDNLASCHAGLEGLLAATDEEPPAATAVLALFDHEEIGSETTRGARSTLLASTLRRVLRGSGDAADLDRALAASWCVSADMAHAVHPAFSDKHDKEHMPKLNGGPVIKQNVNARYSTESDTAGLFLRLCERAEAPSQWFVNRSDLACGSTVGPMVAAGLGIRSVDVGNPMLSMHSAREMCGAHDHGHLARVMSLLFQTGPG